MRLLFKRLILLVLLFRICESGVYARWWEKILFTSRDDGFTQMKDYIISNINSAQLTLDICVYRMGDSPYDPTIPDVIDAINNAYLRGVKVRVVVDADQADDVRERLYSEIPLKMNKTSGLMHSKFMIVDSVFVLSGSANWRTSSFSTRDNNIISTRHSDIVDKYKTQFEQIWQYVEVSKTNYSVTANPYVDLGDGNYVYVRFSPNDKPLSYYTDEVANATKNISFAIYSFTDNSLRDALINQHNSGVIVNGVFDTWSNQYDVYPDLKDAGVSVIRKSTASTMMHNKLIIIDSDMVMTGSMNFTSAGDKQNDECSFIIKDSAVNYIYRRYFRRLWEDSTPQTLLSPVTVSTASIVNSVLSISWNPVTDFDFMQYCIFVSTIYSITDSSLMDGKDNDGDGSIDEGPMYSLDGDVYSSAVITTKSASTTILTKYNYDHLFTEDKFYVAVGYMDKYGNISEIGNNSRVTVNLSTSTNGGGSDGDINDSQFLFNIYPIPSIGGDINIKYLASAFTNIDIQIFDSAGKLYDVPVSGETFANQEAFRVKTVNIGCKGLFMGLMSAGHWRKKIYFVVQ